MTIAEPTTIDAAQNPQDAMAAIGAALEKANAAKATPAPSVDAYPDTHVSLPGGRLRVDGSVDTEAEVKELTGADEEAIAKATNYVKMIDVLLERGVVSVGDEPATKDILNGMLAGDLDMCMLQIRIATLGNEVEYEGVKCPHCSRTGDYSIDLAKDVPVRKLEDGERFFDVEERGIRLSMRLPDRDCMRALASDAERSLASLRTVLLSKCVQRINGLPLLMPEQQVRDLPMRVRDKAFAEIDKRAPGPRMSEVSRPCNECGESIPMPLSLADLFRL